jgi:hypothetical protein
MKYNVHVCEGLIDIENRYFDTLKEAKEDCKYWKKRGFTIVLSARNEQGRFFFTKAGKRVSEWTVYA